MSKPNEDDDDYGAELDAMVQETEKQIKKKTETGGKKSMFQAAVQGGIEQKKQQEQQQNQAQQPPLNSDEEEFKKLQEQMENMDLDKMMQQLFSGALGGGPPGEGAPNQEDMPDFSQITEMLGKMGQDMAKEQQNQQNDGEQNPEMDVDPKHVEEAQKLFKECLDSIQRETAEYQKQQKMEEEKKEENKVEEQIKPKVASAEKPVENKEEKKDEPVIQDDDPNAMFKNFENFANQHEQQSSQQKGASSGQPQADPFAALLQGMAQGEGKDDENPFNNPEMMKMFNQMLGGGAPGSQNDGPNEQNLNEIFKQFSSFLSEQGENDDTFKGALDSVVTEIISKDSLYKPMKNLKEEYPQWLEDNWQDLSDEDLERYNNQLDKVTEICDLFESETINKDMNNKDKVFELLGQLQELGHPPDSLMKHIQEKYGEEAHPAPHQQQPLNLAEGMPPEMANLFASLNNMPAPDGAYQTPAQTAQGAQPNQQQPAKPNDTKTTEEEQPKFNNPFEGL